MGMLPRTSSPFMRPCLLIPFLSDLSLSLSLSVDTDIHGINMDGFMRCPCGQYRSSFLFSSSSSFPGNTFVAASHCAQSQRLLAHVCNSNTGATPVMAWSSWNFFANSINESIALEIGDALVSTGLSEAGYKYVHRSTRAAPRGAGLATYFLYFGVLHYTDIGGLLLPPY